MSETGQDPLLGLAELQRLAELEGQRADLAQKLRGGGAGLIVTELRPLYEAALSQLDHKIGETAANPDLQDKIAGIGMQAVKGLDEMEPLRAILPAEAIAPTESSFRARLKAAAEYFERHGQLTENAKSFIASLQALGGQAVSGAIETKETLHNPDAWTTEAVAPTPSAPEAGVTVSRSQVEIYQPRAVTIVMENTGIRIGSKGRFVPYVSRVGARRDYTPERKAVLRLLLTSEKPLTKSQIWKTIHPEQDPNDGDMERISQWLLGKVKFDRRPLFERSGQGTATRYGRSPDFAPVLVDKTTEGLSKAKPVVPEPLPGMAEEVLGVPGETGTASENLAERKVGDSEIAMGDLCILASKFSTLPGLLQELGLPLIDPELLKRLKAYAPDLSTLNESGVEVYRAAALQRIEAVLEDVEQFEALIDALDDGSLEESFLGYLVELDHKLEGRIPLSQLIFAIPISNRISQLAPGNVPHQESVIRYEDCRDGRPLWPPLNDDERQGALRRVPGLAQIVGITGIVTVGEATDVTTLAATERSEKSRSATPVAPVDGSERADTIPGSGPRILSSEEARTLEQQRKAAKKAARDELAPGEEKRRQKGQDGNRKRSNVEQRTKIDSMRETMVEAATTFLSAFPADAKVRRKQLQGVFGMAFSARTFRDAHENRVLSRGSKYNSYGLRDVIKVAVYRDEWFQSDFRVRSNHRMVERLIDAVITETTVADTAARHPSGSAEAAAQ